MTTPNNVLILFTDQQRFDTIAAAGFSHMKTPNLDRLAKMGTLFPCAHSSNPVCIPARHDLITGLPGRAHGYYENANVPIKDYSLPTLPRIFSNAGYRTATVGKCHHVPVREHHGYGEMHLMEELPRNRVDDQYAVWLQDNDLGKVQNLHGVRPHIYHIPQVAQMDLPHHGTSWVADRTCQWLHENDNDPFMLFCGFIHPHPPWDIPEECLGMYEDADIPEAVPVSRCHPEPTAESQWFGDHDSPQQKRKIREAYYTSITMVDQAVGKILDCLEEKGLMEDTLIIFTSDHGEMLQDKGLYSKEVPYEGSVRVPFIIKLPESCDQPEHLPKGGTCKAFVDTLDVLPTCLDVCGLEYSSRAPYELSGRSVLDKKILHRDIQICSFSQNKSSRWVIARNKTHKYVWNYNGGSEECYDLINDPGEIVNLFERQALPGCIEDLREAVLDWEKQWGPEWTVKDDKLQAQPVEEHHPSRTGKFHMWSNAQMQKFDKDANAVRGERLLSEIDRAMSNAEHSGVKVDEVFNDPEWIESFRGHWNRYGSGDNWHRLFKDKI